jgi:hypothetical protein
MHLLSFALAPKFSRRIQASDMNSLVMPTLDARRYHLLKDWLLKNNIVQHHKMSRNQTEPFVLDTHFYGKTFDDVVDSLAREKDLRDTSSPH